MLLIQESFWDLRLREWPGARLISSKRYISNFIFRKLVDIETFWLDICSEFHRRLPLNIMKKPQLLQNSVITSQHTVVSGITQVDNTTIIQH